MKLMQAVPKTANAHLPRGVSATHHFSALELGAAITCCDARQDEFTTAQLLVKMRVRDVGMRWYNRVVIYNYNK
jgi:hypothetical protein